jgi:hypothetical protein
MTVVVVVAAVGAAVLLLSIVAMTRRRSRDEIDRFKYAAALTSQWAREHGEAPVTVDLREPATASGRPEDAEAVEARSH